MRSPVPTFVITSAAAIMLDIGGLAAERAQLSIDGEERAYLIERPSGQTPRPTIIMLHGLNGSGTQVARQTGLGRFAPDNGFVGVFPDKHAALQGWNFFPPGKEPALLLERSRATGIPDDIRFLNTLVADLVHRGISDPNRIYLAGVSNGSFMTLRIVCSNPRAFAAIALILGGMPEVVGADCTPARPIAAMMINGTADQSVPYAGGPVQPGGLFSAWPTERLIAFFRRLNGCSGTAEQSFLPNIGANTIEVARSTRCAGAPVVAYRVIGGGHVVPSRPHVNSLLLEFFRAVRMGP